MKRIIERIALFGTRQRSELFARLIILASLRGADKHARELGTTTGFAVDLSRIPAFHDYNDRLVTQGRREGKTSYLIKRLEEKFGEDPVGTEDVLVDLSEDDLDRMMSKVASADSLDDVLGHFAPSVARRLG